MAAPTTVKVYPLNDSAKDFPVDFDYLAREFVVVTLLGNDRRELVQNSEYTFLNATSIRTTATWGPVNGGYDNIEVRRVTSATERLVTFNDASILRAADLNLAELQTVHIAQEARDLVSDALGTDDNGNLDARNRRIVNLGNPVDPQDGMTKDYYDSRLGEAKTWRDETLAARDATFTARDVTQGYRDTTLTYKNAAEAARDAGFAARDVAIAARDTTLGYRDTANQHRIDAQAARDLALQYRNEAEGFKNTASAKADIVLEIEDTANSAKAEAQAATAATTGLMDNDLNLFVNGTQRRDIKVKAGNHSAPGNQRAGVRFTDVDVVAVERFNQSTGVIIDTPVRIEQATGDVILTKKLRGLATPTGADEAVNKAYSDLRVLKAGDSLTGPMTFLTPTVTTHPGAMRIDAAFGHQGAHVGWSDGGRRYPVQVDVTDNTAAYSGIRWTQWGVRHVAAIDCYGNNGGSPQIQFGIGSTTRAWIFGEDDIFRGKGGNVWGTWNLNPAKADWINDVGLEGNELRRPYMRRASDGTLTRLVRNFSGNMVETGWDGGVRWYIDGQDMGRTITTLQPWGYFHNAAGRVGRDGDWVVGSGYFDVVIDGSSWGVPFNPSDARRKENIVPSTEDALAKVKLIKFYSFNFKPGSFMDSKKVHQTGFIAQQLQGIDPALVVGDDNPEMTLSPDTNGLLSLALKSIQQLSEQVESLKAEVAALKG
ncbi:putative tail fiber protein [Ralstonia phage RpT1]|nr:putative tail fiber protein [Ralstonia phage RpT1]